MVVGVTVVIVVVVVVEAAATSLSSNIERVGPVAAALQLHDFWQGVEYWLPQCTSRLLGNVCKG